MNNLKIKLKKILIIILLIFTINNYLPKKVNAEGELGGKLLNPVLSLFVTLSDGAIGILHKVSLGSDTPLIEIGPESWVETLKAIICAIVIVVAIVAVIALTGGIAGIIPAVGAMGTITATLVVGGTAVATLYAANTTIDAVFGETYYISAFVITPENIINNSIPLFDVNFFNPKEPLKIKDNYIFSTAYRIRDVISSWYVILRNLCIVFLLCVIVYIGIRIIIASTSQEKSKYKQMITDWVVAMCLLFLMQYIMSFSVGIVEKITDTLNNSIGISESRKTVTVGEIKQTRDNLKEKLQYYKEILEKIKKEEDFSEAMRVDVGKAITDSISFGPLFGPIKYNIEKAGAILDSFYTTNDEEQLIKDLEETIPLIEKSLEDIDYKIENDIDGLRKSIEENKKDEKNEIQIPFAFQTKDKDNVKNAYRVLVKDMENEEDKEIYEKCFSNGEDGTFTYLANTLTDSIRLKLEMVKNGKDGKKVQTFEQIGYKLIYVVVVIYTFIFFFIYLKRVIYMAFLTLISPIVAFTYPIDKINDGKAQAFDMWFKEYIFNLLLQPMHLILYTVLVSTAINFADENPIYVIAVLTFMSQGEKIIRRLFGFESKSNTTGSLSGLAGVAMATSAVSKLFNKPIKGNLGKGNNENSKSNNSKNDEEDNNVNYYDKYNNNDLFEDSENNSNENEIDTSTDTPSMLDEPRDNSVPQNTKGNLESEEENYDILLDNSNNTERTRNNIDDNFTYTPIREPVNSYMTGRTTSNGINRGVNTVSPRRTLKKMPKKEKYRKLRGVAGVAKYLGKTTGIPLAKKAGKIGLGLAVGSLAGTAAMLGGIVKGDDFGDVAKATATGFATGAITGSKSFDGIIKDVGGIKNSIGNTTKGIKNSYRKGSLDKNDYKEAQIQDNIKEYQKNKQFKRELSEELGDREGYKTKEIIKDIVPTCIRYGITDVKEVSAISKMVDDGIDINQAVGTAQFVKDYGKDTNNLSAKDDKELNNTLLNNTEKNSNLKTVEQQETVATKVRDNMNKYSAYLYGSEKISKQTITKERKKPEEIKEKEEIKERKERKKTNERNSKIEKREKMKNKYEEAKKRRNQNKNF